MYQCRDSQKLSGSITADYEDTGIVYSGMPSGWNYVKAFIKSKLGVLFPKLIGGSSTTYFKSAFYGTPSAGVRCPWRFANLNNGGNAGLAAENGNNAPGNSNWNSRPRIYVFMKAGENLLKCVCISAHKRKSVKPEAGKLACITAGYACGK